MGKRTANWYSIVRYRSDDLAGETINIGIILHTFDENEKSVVKFQLLNEHSPKVRAITNDQIDLKVYKSYKDNLEFYLEESVKNLFGEVGEVKVASTLQKEYLDKLHDYYMHEKIFLTRPKFSLTNDLDIFFESLFKSYVGEKYLLSDHKEVSTKKYMKNILREKSLLNKKVKSDYVITPIENLDNIKVNVDFCFKNGVWNYMQGVPNASGPSRNTEWFAKTKFMFENIGDDTLVHLLYRSSDIRTNMDFKSMVKYLSNMDDRIIELDIENSRNLNHLINKIENDAHDLDELQIS